MYTAVQGNKIPPFSHLEDLECLPEVLHCSNTVQAIYTYM